MSDISNNKLRISIDGYIQQFRLIKDFPVTRLSHLHYHGYYHWTLRLV